MSNEKYKVGTKVYFTDPQSGESFQGKVVENNKLPGDIFVTWDTGLHSSYDSEWLDKFTTIVQEGEN